MGELNLCCFNNKCTIFR